MEKPKRHGSIGGICPRLLQDSLRAHLAQKKMLCTTGQYDIKDSLAQLDLHSFKK